LVSGSKQKLPPLWSRVDLAKQFTPQRVAVLGAVAMAVLMVLGISVARRPAASMLPQQPQVRSIQPGGVTLTTHQHRSAPVGVRRVQGRTAAPAPGASRPVPRQQSAASYSEPDVVTHYYQKEKPSPVHQATVAGVRHFSDME
jgi:FtsZ-interacting cell division protein ZipA